MTTSVKLIADSIAPNGVRLSTLVCSYERYFHSECLTHRVHSRNSASSRAIPTKTLIRRIKEDTAMPIHWGLNQKGMQADQEALPELAEAGKQTWLDARDCAIDYAEKLNAMGFHKQIVNRILEPFMHIQVVLSATEWDNFFELRCDHDAQPEFQKLARTIRKTMRESKPNLVVPGGKAENWHLPFIRPSELDLPLDTLKKVSAARCARVSYFLHDGKESSLEKDLGLCDRLVGSRPFHASPFEHQATPLETDRMCRNFRGWKQQRVELEEEAITV